MKELHNPTANNDIPLDDVEPAVVECQLMMINLFLDEEPLDESRGYFEHDDSTADPKDAEDEVEGEGTLIFGASYLEFQNVLVGLPVNIILCCPTPIIFNNPPGIYYCIIII